MQCKNCGAAFNGRFCPNCGVPVEASEESFINNSKTHNCALPSKPKIFYHKWWFWLIMVVAVFCIVSYMSEGKDPGTQKSSKTTSPVLSEVEEPEAEIIEDNSQPTIYTDGTYLVGTDIEAGLYRVEVSDTIMHMGYIERAKAVSMELDDILANIVLTGNGYVEILTTDVAVKFQGVSAVKIDLATLEKNIQSEVSDGMYLIEYDLEPGIYKVEVTDEVMNMAYIERSRSASMGFDDIIANEIVQGQGYIEIKEGDFAVRVQGAKIIKQ